VGYSSGMAKPTKCVLATYVYVLTMPTLLRQAYWLHAHTYWPPGSHLKT